MKYLILLGVLLSAPVFAHEKVNHETYLTHTCDLRVAYEQAVYFLYGIKSGINEFDPINYGKIVYFNYGKILQHLVKAGCRVDLESVVNFSLRVEGEANPSRESLPALNKVFNSYFFKPSMRILSDQGRKDLIDRVNQEDN